MDTFEKVELTYRYIFAFKFTLRSQQPDIVPIICRRCQLHRWCTLSCEYLHEYLKKFAASIIDTGDKYATGIKNTSETGGKIATGVVETGGAP